MTKIINSLIFLLIVYVIIRHLISRRDTHVSDIDKIIREKEKSFGGRVYTPSKKDVVKHMMQFGENPSDYLSKKYFNGHLKFNMTVKEIEATKLDESKEIKKDVFNLALKNFLTKNASLKYKKFSSTDLKIGVYTLIGLSDEFFHKFDGTKKTVLNLKTNQVRVINDVDKFLSDLEKVLPELNRYFLLADSELQNISGAYTKKELAKMYHPDQMNLIYIPKNKRKEFFKLYSDQFSKLLSYKSNS